MIQKEFCANPLCQFHSYKMNDVKFYISSKTNGVVGNTKLNKVETNKFVTNKGLLIISRIYCKRPYSVRYFCDICTEAIRIKEKFYESQKKGF